MEITAENNLCTIFGAKHDKEKYWMSWAEATQRAYACIDYLINLMNDDAEANLLIEDFCHDLRKMDESHYRYILHKTYGIQFCGCCQMAAVEIEKWHDNELWDKCWSNIEYYTNTGEIFYETPNN